MQHKDVRALPHGNLGHELIHRDLSLLPILREDHLNPGARMLSGVFRSSLLQILAQAPCGLNGHHRLLSLCLGLQPRPVEALPVIVDQDHPAVRILYDRIISEHHKARILIEPPAAAPCGVPQKDMSPQQGEHPAIVVYVSELRPYVLPLVQDPLLPVPQAEDHHIA